jgi:hypothetical protein
VNKLRSSGQRALTIGLLIVSTMLVSCDSGAATNSASGAAASPTAGAVRSFAGQVAGSDAFIAIVASPTKMMAYVCDGTNDQVSISEWFRGSISGDTFDLISTGGAHLLGKLADQASGTVKLSDGRELSFSAQAAQAPAGLYRAEQTVAGTSYVGGWIVLNDAQQRGAANGGGQHIGASFVTEGGVATVRGLGQFHADFVGTNIEL